MEARARRIDLETAPIVASPSGLATRYLVDGAVGSTRLFVAEQSLRTGDRVLNHRHPVEEVLCFQSGSGIAMLDGEQIDVGSNVTLFIPAGVPHGFENTGPTPLRVIVIFPGTAFAETELLEPRPSD